MFCCYIDSVVPQNAWAPLKALLLWGYSVSLFSIKGAHAAALIYFCGGLTMPVFFSWLPVFSIYLGIHCFWDHYLSNICFKLVMGSKLFQDGIESGKAGQAVRLQKPCLFKKLVKKKNLSTTKKITCYNKSLPVLQSTDIRLTFSGLSVINFFT